MSIGPASTDSGLDNVPPVMFVIDGLTREQQRGRSRYIVQTPRCDREPATYPKRPHITTFIRDKYVRWWKSLEHRSTSLIVIPRRPVNDKLVGGTLDFNPPGSRAANLPHQIPDKSILRRGRSKLISPTCNVDWLWLLHIYPGSEARRPI